MNPDDEQESVQEVCDELSQFSLVDAPTIEDDGDDSMGSFSFVSSQEGFEVVSRGYAPSPTMQFLTATGLAPSKEGERLAMRYLDAAEDNIDLALGLYFDSDPRSSAAPYEADADTTKKSPPAEEDMGKKSEDVDTEVDCLQKAESEGWPSVASLDDFIQATGLEDSEDSRGLARAYLTATDCNVDLAVHVYLDDAQSLDGSVSVIETETGDAFLEPMKQLAGGDVVMAEKEYNDRACSYLEDFEVASIRQSRWQETRTRLEFSGKDGLSSTKISQSDSAFAEDEQIGVWRKLVNREKESEKESEGLQVGSPDDTDEKIEGILSKYQARVRNAPSYGGPSMPPRFMPVLERLRLSRDIDDLIRFKNHRQMNYSIPVQKMEPSDFAPVAPVPGVDLKKPSEPAEGDIRYHWVGPDDSLRRICLKYKVSTNDLCRANGFTGSNLKAAPRKLVIPQGTTPLLGTAGAAARAARQAPLCGWERTMGDV